MNGKTLTWNDLADAYSEAHTTAQRPARTLRMNMLFEWAEKQTDKFKVTEEGTIERV